MLDINILKDSYEDAVKYEQNRKQYELNGKFFEDQDPVVEGSYEPLTEDFPFIRKGPIWAIKSFIYNTALNKYTKKINKELTNLKIVGQENLKGLKGAIITCNHISKVDSFAVREACKENIMFVAAEFNNWKGAMGKISRNTGYIPLPANLNLKLMRKFNEAISFYLKKGKKILIYPEQAMWREFPKPRPLQNGAFHYAVINNVPVLPMFITVQPKTNPADEQGRANFGDYTIHILPPIYPKKELTSKENEKYMKLENFRLCQECYEATYEIKLKYTTKKEVWDKNFNEYNQFLTDLTKQKQPIKPVNVSKVKKSVTAKRKAQQKTTNKKATKK